MLERCERKILLSWRLVELPNTVIENLTRFRVTIRCHHVASLTIYLVSTASLQLFLMLPKLMVTELLCRAHVGRHMTEQALGLSSLNMDGYGVYRV